MSILKITRSFDGADITFKVTEDEIIAHISNMPMDERLVLLRKLAGKDLQQVMPIKLFGELLKK
jgi:hypothetical protein